MTFDEYVSEIGCKDPETMYVALSWIGYKDKPKHLFNKKHFLIHLIAQGMDTNDISAGKRLYTKYKKATTVPTKRKYGRL